MRVSAGAAATVRAQGPGSGQIGTSVTPRPTASTAGASTDAAVKRAKAIALGLFVALVLVHTTKGD